MIVPKHRFEKPKDIRFVYSKKTPQIKQGADDNDEDLEYQLEKLNKKVTDSLKKILRSKNKNK